MASVKPLYNGLFIDKEDFANKCKTSLAQIIKNPHATIHYWGGRSCNNHIDLHKEWTNCEIELVCYGYGNDGENEGYLCFANSNNMALLCELGKVPCLHITTSVSNNGKPKNTANLIFSQIEPFSVKARYGVYYSNGEVK